MMSRDNGEFDIGDVVCLNSGSPPMTITAFADDGSLVLVYADLNGNLLRESLSPRAVSLTETRWSIGCADSDIEFDEEDEDY